MATFGERLRAAREAKGVTQGDFSKLVGVSEPTVGRWEKGTSAPDATQLPAIAEALGTTIFELMGEPAPTPKPEDEIVDPKQVSMGLRSVINNPGQLRDVDKKLIRMLSKMTFETLEEEGTIRKITKEDCD